MCRPVVAGDEKVLYRTVICCSVFVFCLFPSYRGDTRILMTTWPDMGYLTFLFFSFRCGIIPRYDTLCNWPTFVFLVDSCCCFPTIPLAVLRLAYLRQVNAPWQRRNLEQRLSEPAGSLSNDLPLAVRKLFYLERHSLLVFESELLKVSKRMHCCECV